MTLYQRENHSGQLSWAPQPTKLGTKVGIQTNSEAGGVQFDDWRYSREAACCGSDKDYDFGDEKTQQWWIKER